MVSIFEDITARKQAELEVARLNANLERCVAERTAELQAANAELETFAYAVSHDLRAPLRAMAGFSAALEEDCGASLSPEGREDLAHITEASLRMGGLIDALLKLCHTTRCELERVPVDLSSLGQALLADLARSEPDRQVQTRVEPGIGAVGDPHMLAAVMANLLGNAWKYTSRTRGARIEVTTDRAAGARRIRIQDNGCGFDMAHADKLFKPFQRLHRQDEYPGLGIGLATAQRIVLRHGGALEAESAPGQGAVFILSLPEPFLPEPSCTCAPS
jgi:light-regulated signal transduction histidine kinase (bacteriophytochrome)